MQLVERDLSTSFIISQGTRTKTVVVIRNGKLLFADMFSNQKYVALSVDLAEPLSRTFKKP